MDKVKRFMQMQAQEKTYRGFVLSNTNTVFSGIDYQTDIFLRTLDTWKATGKTDAASVKAVFSGTRSEVWNGDYL